MAKCGIPTRNFWFRCVSLGTMAIFLTVYLTACYRWQVIPMTELRDISKSRKIYIKYLPKGSAPPIEVQVERIEFPYVYGSGPYSADVKLDLRLAKEVHIRKFDGSQAGTIVAWILLTPVAIAAVLLFIALLTSCPFVYVDQGKGLVFVGEAYAGAAFRSIQRDDLLPLPNLYSLTPRIRLANMANETQFTDLAKLMIVDHAPTVRVLSGMLKKLFFVGKQIQPAKVVDLHGKDVRDSVLYKDKKHWMSNMEKAAMAPQPSLREGLIATFPPMAPGKKPVLELHARNTIWADVIMGRYFALYGNGLKDFLEKKNKYNTRSYILKWKEREGLDLRIEVYMKNQWKKVKMLTTIGPAALRHVAIALPPEITSPNKPIQVRISGGLGFLRVDQMALSSLELSAKPRVRLIAPKTAKDDKNRNQSEQIDKVDGKYNALPKYKDRIDLHFKLPPKAKGTKRTSFLYTNGYYHVHQPPQSSWQPLTLLSLRDKKGSLAKFSLDLYRKYLKLSKTPPAPKPH